VHNRCRYRCKYIAASRLTVELRFHVETNPPRSKTSSGRQKVYFKTSSAVTEIVNIKLIMGSANCILGYPEVILVRYAKVVGGKLNICRLS